MRQLVDLLNTFAGSAARQQSGLPASPYSAPAAPLPAPLSPAARAAHPALAAAEAALVAKLANSGTECDADYALLNALNEQLWEEGSFLEANACRELNRYCDVLPFDDNRVALGDASTRSLASAANGGSRRGGSLRAEAQDARTACAAHYINASPLRGGGEGDVQWSYIAAQGPLKHTREAFWQMVAEQGCGTVVMLTNIVERGVSKCARYFPEAPRTSKYLGRYLVGTRALEQLLPDLHRRTLSVRDTLAAQQAQHASSPAPRPQQPAQQPAAEQAGDRPAKRASVGHSVIHATGSSSSGSGRSSSTSSSTSRSSWAVQHYHYGSWPDHGVPASPEPLLALCEELRHTGAHVTPIIVHCSAGIGRSGVFVVLDVVTRRLRRLAASHDAAAGAAAVDVAALVAELRRQRLGMVQTREQYVFCHTALLHFVRRLASQPPGQPPPAEQRQHSPKPPQV